MNCLATYILFTNNHSEQTINDLIEAGNSLEWIVNYTSLLHFAARNDNYTRRVDLYEVLDKLGVSWEIIQEEDSVLMEYLRY